MAKSSVTVTFGGWYQRTTLHLSEIYDLLALGKSKLSLSPEKLKKYQQSLDLDCVTRQQGMLEYIHATTREGIEFDYYEDGLYVLRLETDNVLTAKNKLIDYFENKLSPAINYIFSLGAPTPKVLAQIPIEHPTVLVAHSPESYRHIQKTLNINPDTIYNNFKGSGYSFIKTPDYIILQTPSGSIFDQDLVNMQIFFREFKDQLERYLLIHRNIWEEITKIKEQKFLRGYEVETVRCRLDGLQKTINLISSRINQMSVYLNTRSSICKKLNLDGYLLSIFEYKFETLSDTHQYIKEIWTMTREYLNTAIQVILEVKNQSTSNGIQSLRLITTLGVIANIFMYISKDAFPVVTLVGVWYFAVLFLGTWFINNLVGYVFSRKKYELKFQEITSTH